MESKAYWVGFNLVKGVGAVRLKALLDYFGDLAVAWQAPVDALQQAGMSGRVIENLLQVRASVSLEHILAHYETMGIRVITWEDADYPKRLREIEQSPPVLYVRGEMTDTDQFAVAIVGTRRITPYGRQVSEELAAFLAQNGISVVSGLARGVDAVAHQAALRAGGRTIAVLGSGVDKIYPPEHTRLAEEIIQRGALVSDYGVGTPPDSVNFPPRNRIIAGLSIATVVVEAGETSGALITATFAVEQGREVFGVPGNIYAPQSKGVNRLIQHGAHVLANFEDILDVLHLDQVSEKQSARAVIPGNDLEAQILNRLGYEPLHIDEIHLNTGLPIEEVSAVLTIMELKGMARHVGGMKYVAIREQRSTYQVNQE